MKDKTPYNLNLVKINNHAKLIAEQENKFHKKQKTMSKKYLGSQEAFEYSINEHYDAIEEREKQQQEEINKQINEQIKLQAAFGIDIVHAAQQWAKEQWSNDFTGHYANYCQRDFIRGAEWMLKQLKP